MTNKLTITPGPEKDVPAEPAPVPAWWSEECTDNRPVMMYKKEGWTTISRDYIECLVNLAELMDDPITNDTLAIVESREGLLLLRAHATLPETNPDSMQREKRECRRKQIASVSYNDWSTLERTLSNLTQIWENADTAEELGHEFRRIVDVAKGWSDRDHMLAIMQALQ